METQSMLVVPKGEDGEIDVYVSTQFPKYIQVTRGPEEGAWLNGFCQQNGPRTVTGRATY